MSRSALIFVEFFTPGDCIWISQIFLCDDTWGSKIVEDRPVQFVCIGKSVWRHGNSIWVSEPGQTRLQVGHCFVYTTLQTLDTRERKGGERRIGREQSDNTNTNLNTQFEMV